MLKGCKVVAVSATSLSSRKWAKRYPIKLESKNVVLYQGSKVLHVYLDTSWEKESWCEALRVASCDDKERLEWFSKLNEEFHKYLRSLIESYPSLVKPCTNFHASSLNKANRLDGPPSKVRQLWKKLAKKASLPSHDERRLDTKSGSFQDSFVVPDAVKTSFRGTVANECTEDDSLSSSCASIRSGNASHVSEIPDGDVDEKFVVDEGTLCWNLLISRLFFDAKSNVSIKSSLKERIQRMLSNMRIPSYIGEVTCGDIDLGDLPPYINGMRAVPMDMNDVWALEVDIEYSGGLVLYIETRLEVRELDLQDVMGDQNVETNSVKEVTSDLLEDFEQFDKDLKHSNRATNSTGQDEVNPKVVEIKSSKSGLWTAPGSKWRSILNSVAKHVSQVPLVLAIRVASLKGTIRLHIKPPPSDQLWFGFTSMPNIHFHLESSVGDHKITSGHVASFLISRFKASIRDTLVLPNVESVCLPWMLAEKDDWIPRNAAPFIWIHREGPIDPTAPNESSKPQSSELNSKSDYVKHRIGEEAASTSSIPRSINMAAGRSESLQNLTTPLLEKDETRENCSQRREENPECLSPTRYVSLREEDDDSKPKRTGRRAKMLDLGKKMSEKLEEKRRHIEETSRHIVGKMRGPANPS